MQLSKYIDHTLLKAEAREEQVLTLCEEAIEHDFASVCVNSSFVPMCATVLKGSNVKVCTVVGFPLGAMASEIKAREARWSVMNGADEVDMVINIGYVKDGKWDAVAEDIHAVVLAVRPNTVVKVILETCLLEDREISKLCKLVKDCGADFVKTSTGFSTGGATVEHIKLMRQSVGPDFGVKASGGVRSLKEAELMIQAGATRIGTSSGVAIVTGGQGTDSY